MFRHYWTLRTPWDSQDAMVPSGSYGVLMALRDSMGRYGALTQYATGRLRRYGTLSTLWNFHNATGRLGCYGMLRTLTTPCTLPHT